MSGDGGRPGGISPERERQSHVRHELRTPLTVMYPLLSVLLDGVAGELTAKQRDYLETMERNVVRLDGLIGSMADSGWFDCAQSCSEIGDISLRDAIDDVLSWREARGVPGPAFEIHVQGDPRALADREQARCVVGNLLDNAVLYGRPGGGVRLSAAAPRDGIVSIEVADEGPGIPRDELSQVFTFGFRGAAARTAAIPGLGIGLWVSRELAIRNGGDLALESAAGSGTSVTFTLPAAGSA